MSNVGNGSWMKSLIHNFASLVNLLTSLHIVEKPVIAFYCISNSSDKLKANACNKKIRRPNIFVLKFEYCT